jgi:hypothetical protein
MTTADPGLGVLLRRRRPADPLLHCRHLAEPVGPEPLRNGGGVSTRLDPDQRPRRSPGGVRARQQTRRQQKVRSAGHRRGQHGDGPQREPAVADLGVDRGAEAEVTVTAAARPDRDRVPVQVVQ